MFRIDPEFKKLIPDFEPRDACDLMGWIQEKERSGDIRPSTASYVIGRYIAPLVTRESELRKRQKQSARQDAAKARSLVIDQSGGLCRCCGVSCGPIMEVHHLNAIADGGLSSACNLIGLCPNCHTIVEKLRRLRCHKGELDKLYEWLFGSYPDRVVANLTCVANLRLSLAKLFGGKE